MRQSVNFYYIDNIVSIVQSSTGFWSTKIAVLRPARASLSAIGRANLLTNCLPTDATTLVDVQEVFKIIRSACLKMFWYL